MILLDTQVLLWIRRGDPRLGERSRRRIESALRDGAAAVSAFTFWEVAMLHEKRRLRLLSDVGSWRQQLLGDGLVEIAVDGEIGIRANQLVDFHGDPADRIVVATALEGHRLVTADQGILMWSGALDRVDARA